MKTLPQRQVLSPVVWLDIEGVDLLVDSTVAGLKGERDLLLQGFLALIRELSFNSFEDDFWTLFLGVYV